MIRSAPIREALFLVRNGVPFDVAFQLDDAMRAGWCIVFSEMDGATFDTRSMTFREES